MGETRNRTMLIYVVAIIIPVAVGILSAFLTGNNMMIFAELNKPPLAPPAWLFPVAWTILYVLMGLASARICLSGHPSTMKIMAVYVVQLIFNFFWSIIFFNFSMYWIATAWLLVMWLLILTFIKMSVGVDIVAVVCFIPYAIWCTFAMYLNIGVAVLN